MLRVWQQDAVSTWIRRKCDLTLIWGTLSTICDITNSSEANLAEYSACVSVVWKFEMRKRKYVVF